MNALLPAAPAGPPTVATRAGELVVAFLAGRRPTTLRTYRIALDDFRRFLGAPTAADAARTLLLASHGDANRLAHAWAGTARERGLAPTTVHVRLAALRALVHLARLQGLVAWTLDVRGPRPERLRDTRGPGRTGVRALLAAAATARTPRELRDAGLLRLLSDLALRRAEVTSLDVADVDLVGEPPTIAVLGKGRDARTKLTLPGPTKEALAAWLVVRGTEAGPLFTGLSRGRAPTRLTGTSLARIVRRLGEEAGLPGLHPHGLRHAAITAALDETKGDVRLVQRYSRHADPRTLLLYDDRRRDGAGDVARLVAAWR
jgi:integrase/recombinase XerC